MARYNDLDYVMDMDVLDGLRIIYKARQQKTEERMFTLYASAYTNMDEKTYIPFEKFYNPKVEIESNKSAEEILADVKESLDKHQGNWGDGK